MRREESNWKCLNSDRMLRYPGVECALTKIKKLGDEDLLSAREGFATIRTTKVMRFGRRCLIAAPSGRYMTCRPEA